VEFVRRPHNRRQRRRSFFGAHCSGRRLNRIQNGSPELSVESYGTRWVLYDPATGRYFDDIVKGDSRVLWTAGIPNEDGDTFLDVRPPPGQVEQANVWRWWIALKTELKVAVIGGLFAIVTGIGNLVVATYNGAKVSPTATAEHPSPSARVMPSQSFSVPPLPSPTANPAEFAVPSISARKSEEQNYPYGTRVPGKPGYVLSPYVPGAGEVDVRGFPPGAKVQDPYSGKIFLVP
jgi:hypothetical protein